MHWTVGGGALLRPRRSAHRPSHADPSATGLAPS